MNQNPVTRLLARFLNSATATSWLNMCAQILGTLILIPLIGRRWSSFDLATFLLISSVNRFTLLISDRFAVTFSMLFSYVAAGSTDLTPRKQLTKPTEIIDLSTPEARERQQKLFQRTFATLGTLLLGLSILSVGVTGAISFASLLRLGADYDVNVWPGYLTLALCLGALFARINLLRYEVALRGLDKIALLGRWNALFNGTGLVISIAAVLSGFGILAWGIIAFSTTVLTGIRNYFLLRMLKSEFDIAKSPKFAWDRELVSAAWEPTWRGLLGNISYIGGEELVSLLTPFLLPAPDVTSFLLYNRFYTTIGAIAQIPMTSRTPYMAKLIAEGNRTALTKFVSFRILFCSCLVVIGANAIGLLVPLLTYFFDKPVPTIPLITWSMIVVLLLFERLNTMLTIVLEAGNTIVYYWRRCVVTIVTICTLPFFYHYFGVAGGFFAILVPRVVLFHGLILSLVTSYLGIHWSAFLKKIYLPVFASHAFVTLLMQVAIFSSHLRVTTISDLTHRVDAKRKYSAKLQNSVVVQTQNHLGRDFVERGELDSWGRLIVNA
jgi:hypothetical protein